MANEQNLIPGNQPYGHTLTREEQSAGGKASGKARRLQGAIKRALESKASSPELQAVFDEFKIDENNRDYATAIGCVVIQKAVKGDLSAMSFIRDTVGEKPKEEISLEGGVAIVDDIKDSPPK